MNMQQNGYKFQSPKQPKEWQEGWCCCFITQKGKDIASWKQHTKKTKSYAKRNSNDESFEGAQKHKKKTPKEIRVMEEINEKS